MAGNFFGGQFFGGGFFGALVTTTVQPSGGYPTTHERRRTRKEISEARQRIGIEDAIAKEAIAEVAARQAERLELDKQKQFDELHGELRLRNIEWQTRYLEAMNAEREHLIGVEIGRRLRERLARQAEEEMWLFLQVVAAAL